MFKLSDINFVSENMWLCFPDNICEGDQFDSLSEKLMRIVHVCFISWKTKLGVSALLDLPKIINKSIYSNFIIELRMNQFF